MSEWKAFFVVVAIAVPTVALACEVVMRVGNKHESWKCTSMANTTGVTTVYVEYDSCYVVGKDNRLHRYDETYRSNY